MAALLIAKPHLPFGDAEVFADQVLCAVFCGHMVQGTVGSDATPQQLVNWLMSSRRG